MTRQRVVVTGVGAVTPLGHDATSTFDGLAAGRSGTALASFPIPDGLEVKVTAEVRGLDLDAVLGAKFVRRSARCTQLAMVAAREAVKQAALQGAVAPERTGVVLGTGAAGSEWHYDAVVDFREKGPARVSPFALPALLPNMPAATVALELGLKGPNFGVTSACASGAHAIGQALALLRAGMADAIVTGGTESYVTPGGLSLFARIGALSRRNDDPERASRPFDRSRDGFVMAEGAGLLVLERLESAQRRGAKILAEVAGAGASCDAHHVTHPDPEGSGMQRAMRAALADAELAPEAVRHVSAHASATPTNDGIETRALKATFGAHAKSLWITGTKGALGHLLGAAGAVQSVAAVFTIERGLAPPTRNLEDPDPECDLDYVPRTAREGRIDAVLVNAFAFGGQNGCVVLRRFE